MARGELDIIYEPGELAKAFQLTGEQLDTVVRETMDDVLELALEEGRREIRGAGGEMGQSDNWINNLKGYISDDKDGEPQITVYHRIKYAGIFETGGKIEGKPYIWLPTKIVPTFASTPKKFARNFPDKPLRSARGKQRRPMLVAKIGFGRIKGGFGPKSVPVFIGVRSINVRKRFSIAAAVNRAAAKFETFYARHLRRLTNGS